MSYEDGWAAVNLEGPRRIPRTEYSAESYHWPLVSRVTGIEVTGDSPAELREEASLAFMTAWNYDFCWNTLIGRKYLGERSTNMGHAAYAIDGSDQVTGGPAAFSSPEEVLAFDPLEELPFRYHSDLVDRFSAHYRSNRDRFPDAVNMTGTYITVVSGLIDLLGWDMLLLTAGTDLEKFGEFTNRYADWVMRFYRALADSETPMIMMHDDIVWTSGPFLDPEWYRRFVFPNYRRYLEPVREAGKKIAFTSDGDFTAFIDDIAGAGVHGFACEPLTDMAQIAERYGKTHFFVGNADTRILLDGDPAKIRAEVQRCISIGRDCPGFFVAVGNHIPANTPIEAALCYNECYEEMMWRT